MFVILLRKVYIFHYKRTVEDMWWWSDSLIQFHKFSYIVDLESLENYV